MDSGAEHRFARAIVAGAAGGVGALLLERLTRLGHQVVGLDRVTGEGVIGDDAERPSPAMEDRLSTADLVILALPDAVSLRVGPALASRLAPSALLVDCSSIKTPYARAVDGIGQCERLSINPLFGPDLDPRGRSVAFTALQAGPVTLQFERFLTQVGMRLVRLAPEAHDRAMADLQAGTHVLLLAHLLGRADADIEAGPPPAAVLERLGARVAAGAPHVYWSIQADNPWAAPARQRLIATLQSLDAAITAGDRQSFEAQLERARTFLGGRLAGLTRDCVRMFEAIGPSPSYREQPE